MEKIFNMDCRTFDQNMGENLKGNRLVIAVMSEAPMQKLCPGIVLVDGQKRVLTVPGLKGFYRET